jgi:hypothetical protein
MAFFPPKKLVDLHHQLVRFEHQGGQFTGAYGIVQTSADFVPKIVSFNPPILLLFSSKKGHLKRHGRPLAAHRACGPVGIGTA